MKKLVILILVNIMLCCTAESVADLGNELLKEKNYQVGLSTNCTQEGGKVWYCVSKDEYDRLKEIPRTCETITITSISGNRYSGIINDDSFTYSNTRCL